MYAELTNSGFLPIATIHYKDAVRYLIKGKAYATHEYRVFYNLDDWMEFAKNNVELQIRKLRTPNSVFYIPTSMMCPTAVFPKSPPYPSRRSVYIRDKGRCGYCGNLISYKESTKDHIIPISKGGSKVKWTNIILACGACNSKKADKMLHEIGFTVKNRVYTPTWADLLLSNYRKTIETN